MKKISVFCSFFAFLLATASMVATPAHAQASGSGYKFCYFGKTSGGGINPSHIKIKQEPASYTTPSTNISCYTTWANLYNYLKVWAANLDNQVEGSYIEIASDINFAGRNDDDGSCKTGDDAFGGKILDLNDKIILVGSSGASNFTISGLCHVSSTDEEVGFVKGAKKIENIDFDNMYFKSTKSDSKVGIVTKNGQDESHTYQNIHVKNSEFYGDNVGAILGYGEAYLNNISLTNVTIDGGIHAGGIAGYLYAAGLNEVGAANKDSYGKFNIETLKISGASSFSANTSYFGGVAGYAVYKGKRELSECVLQNLNIQGADYAGGVFGFAQYTSTTEPDDSKFSDIYIGNTGNTSSIIQGNKYVGGLIGSFNEGYAEGTSFEVSKNGVNANVKGGKTNDSRVGGLIGSIVYSSAHKMNLIISNNYVIGHVYNTLDKNKVGYLVGELPREVINFVSVQYNYHYGEYNSSVNSAKIGIGSFEVQGDWLEPAENNGTSVVISHNFRNDYSGKTQANLLKADGALENAAKPVVDQTGVGYYNGIISDSKMKTNDFVNVLNRGGAGTDNWEHENNALPTVINNVIGSQKYNVTFDLSTLSTDSYIVFGSAWATNDMTLSKKMPAYDGPANTVEPESESRFPKAYIRGLDDNGNEKFFQLRWKYEKTATDYYDYLKTSLLTGKDVTVYAALDKSFNPIARRAIDVVVIDDKDVNAVSYRESDYHGSIVLSQKVGGVTYENKSELVNVAPGQSLHRLFIAFAYNDTLIFNVSVDPKPGYEMTVVEANNPWADAPADENWGYNKDLGTFKYYANKMDGKLVTFKVLYKELSYNLKFTIPESMQDKGLYIVSEKDGFESLSDVTVDGVNAPIIYDSEGCRVNWIVAGEDVASHASTGKIEDEFQYMKANDLSVENVLIPDLDHRDCSANAKADSYKITLNVVDGEGEIVLLQKIGNGADAYEIEHAFTKNGNKLELEIPKVYEGANNLPNSVELKVKAVPVTGYVFDYVTYEDGGVAAAPTTIMVLDGGSVVVNRDMVLNVKFNPMSPVDLVFNENAGDGPSFFSDSWTTLFATGVLNANKAGNWTFKQSYAIGDKDSKFPLEIYRDGYCLQGYTLAKNDKTDGVFTKFDDAFIKASDAANAIGAISLYGYWETCSNQGYTVYAADGDKGTLTLTKTFALDGSNEAVRTYEVGSKGLKIPSVKGDISFTGISFEVKDGAGVILNSDKPYTYKDHDAESGWKEFKGSLKVTSDLDIKAPLLMDLFNSTYALDVNATDVFYGDGFDRPVWIAVSFGDKLPTNIYRTDAELVGWSFEQDATPDKAMTVFDKKFVETFESYENASQFGVNLNPSNNVYPVLFAVWKTRVMPTYTVKSDEKNKGVLTLEQNVNGKVVSREVGEKLLVPAVTGGLEFYVRFEADNNWLLDEGESLVWKTTGGTAEVTEKIANESYKRVDNDYVVTALGKTKEFHLVLDESSDEKLYYGGDWTKEIDNASANDKGSTTFPKMAYSTDQCLAGWSVTPDATTIYKEMCDELINEIYAAYPNLDETTKVKLYARWTTDVEGCAGNVSRITVESDHGSVELVEKNGKDNTVHKLDENGQLMLPSEIDNDKWTVRVVPDSSYMLDSLVIKKKDKVVAVIHEGDKLPKDMDDVVLTAYFEKSNKTPIEIVNNVTHTSGNTLQLDFTSSKFEVTRDVSARVEIIDTETGKTVNVISIGDSIASAYADKIPVRVDRPGSYKVVLTLTEGDGKVSDESVTYFTVPDPFEKIVPESWNMLSFAAVDASSIMFEEGVQFYWWDEGGVGEYWQYKSIHRDDTLDASRGYWYTSPHGAPLVWREDYKDDGKDIEWTLDCENSGWNLVANPHGWYVDLYSNYKDKKKNADEESEVEFWRYDPKTGGYDDEVEYLEPFEAVWVHVKKKTKWTVSAEPVYDNEIAASRENSKGSLNKSATKNSWTLRMALSDENGKLDSKNLVGVSDRPFNDEEPPASMGDHVNLSIVDGKRALAKSIKAPEEDMEWTISLAASSVRKGYLTIDGIADVKSLGYRVLVTVDGETTEMQEGKSLPVLLKSSSKTATVRVTKDAPVVAKNALIKGLRSARLGNKLHVTFDAPESLAGSNARVELLDVKGGVKSSVSAKAIFGTNALELDAPQAGLYLLRVRAGSARQISRVLVK